MCAEKRAIQLFDEAILWLKSNYGHFRFFTERDIVWTLQLHLLEDIEKQRLTLMVFENHKMPNNTHIDLAILEQGTGAMLVGVELKYEPDHARTDIFPGKFPKVFWNSERNHGVVQDVERIDNLIDNGNSVLGFVLFIDEGRHHSWRKAPKGSIWDYSWGKSPYSEKTMAILNFKRKRE
jgi:hypothetical protein